GYPTQAARRWVQSGCGSVFPWGASSGTRRNGLIVKTVQKEDIPGGERHEESKGTPPLEALLEPHKPRLRCAGVRASRALDGGGSVPLPEEGPLTGSRGR